MAPSATETVTVPVVTPLAEVKLNARSIGQYKELAAHELDLEAEAGQKGFAAAKVSSGLCQCVKAER
jgi:hypothetical protein